MEQNMAKYGILPFCFICSFSPLFLNCNKCYEGRYQLREKQKQKWINLIDKNFDRSSLHSAVETNPTRKHEVVGSIPWDPALL